MRRLTTVGGLVCLALILSLPGWGSTSKTSKTSTPTASKKKTSAVSRKGSPKSGKRVRARKGSWKHRGQQTIATDRTIQIQEALIRAGYLSGSPSGTMDEGTKVALKRLQEDNGWQTRIVPDSRALIKLGLGPKHDNLINPNTAAISAPSDIRGVSTRTQR